MQAASAKKFMNFLIWLEFCGLCLILAHPETDFYSSSHLHFGEGWHKIFTGIKLAVVCSRRTGKDASI